MSRNYSNTAVDTTLSTGIDGVTTVLTVAAVTGFPAAPFVLALEPSTATQELVLVTAVGGTTLTVTRGYDNTVAQSHTAGAVVQHSHAARDFKDSRDHEAATAAHGATGAVVGTSNAQTLTNKTFSTADNDFLAPAESHFTTLSAENGTLTDASSAGLRYVQLGKMVFFEVSISIVAKGTATGSLRFTLPVACRTSGGFIGHGRHSTSGHMLQAVAFGTSAHVFKYDNSTPLTDGATLTLRGSYEAV